MIKHVREVLFLHSKKNKNKYKMMFAFKLAGGMLIATAAGMAAGMILAPKSGKEIRCNIKKNTMNKVNKVMDSVKKNITPVKNSVFQSAQNMGNAFKNTVTPTEGSVIITSEGKVDEVCYGQ